MAKLSLRLICLVCVFCALAVIGYPADTFKSLASFNFTDGSNTLAPVVQGLDGNFYGTTFQGGANCGGRMENCPGTVFRMSPNGTLATLHRFCSQPNCIDGYNPSAGLIQATDGNFYSTTNSRGAYGYGTVFRMSSRGL